ncbi:hypothetical protein H5410_036014 [Solanum commersonii]|uniref:Cytochrome P450 n=1 Tax=Solanum commersonii TaxID=4109 RepID=A0A9J5Y6W4_SOLCO|nr:hypothetical protein H5410_036014 [Solanum commersonii]
MLSPKSLQWLHHKRDEEADHLHRFIYNQCKNQGVITLRKVTRRYSGNVIRNMSFRKRLCEIIGEDEQVDALFTLFEYLHAFGISDYFPWLSVFDLDDGNKSLEEDILDVLIMLKDSNGNPLMNVNEIKAQVLELMLATVDNPPNAVEWALAEMLNQPKLMQRTVEELHTVVGMNRLVQESDLPRLNYYFIPKGSVVLLSRLGLGRNPIIWEDPLKFKPERQLIKEDGGEVVLTNSKLRLLSFSFGRRGCPGVKLGSTITTMLLAMLLHGFSWSLPPNTPCNDLIESSKTDHFGSLPLLAQAKPRLAKDMYP